ncbi:hypothetical protein [Roseateles sp. P5_E1]
MLKKLTVLDKILELESFTIAQLSEASGITGNTVQTVVNRCPPLWLESESSTTGAKGGQPKRYELTELGKAQIRAQLALLPATPSVRSNGKPPAGIALAEKALDQLRTAVKGGVFDGDQAKFWRDEAWSNLEWAKGELEGSNQHDQRHRLAELREEVLRLDIERRVKCEKELEVRPPAERRPPHLAQTAEATRSRRKLELMTSAGERPASSPAAAPALPSFFRTVFSGMAQQPARR